MESHSDTCHPYLIPARFTYPPALDSGVDLSIGYTEMVYLSIDSHPSK